MSLNYAQSGVSRVAGDQLVEKIKKITGQTKAPQQLKSSVGGYASLYAFNKKEYVAATTDGVGTKLKLAFDWDSHSTVGIDLVAMSVNDLLCVGAEPLFFLDYFATGKLDVGTAAQVIGGIHKGCEQAECFLVGGETAEMPGFYADGEYDLAGFAVGKVLAKNVLPQTKGKNKVSPGDVLIGLGSSGFHSNGYSLIRKLFEESKSADPAKLALELLTPTQIYIKALKPGLQKGIYKALAHITGSGMLNIPRMGEHVSYQLTLPTLKERPKVYQWLNALNRVEFSEQLRTFNCGIGMVIALDPKHAKKELERFKKIKQPAWLLGQVVSKPKNSKCTITVESEEGIFKLYADE